GELRLCEVAAWATAHLRASPVRRQVWPRRDLDSPSLIIGEMQGQTIELVRGHEVDVPLHGRRIDEMAGDVEHGAAPDEARGIGNARSGQPETSVERIAVLDGPRQQLSQGLHAVEQPVRLRGRE